MKTEEIEQIGREIHYQSQNEGLDSNGSFNQYQGFIKGYTQCQKKMQNDIDELVDELEKIKKYGVSDLELEILIKKHTKK